MKSLLALFLALACTVVLAADDDQRCKSDFKSFMTCVKGEHDKKSASDKDKAKQERKDKANKCFADASCDAPDWDANPMGGGKHGAAAGGGMGADMPKVVKDCLKKKLLEKIGAKMNECLSKKGVKNVNMSAMAEMAGDSGFDFEGGDGDEAKEGLQGAMKAKFNAVKAVDKCAQKKGGDTNSVKPLEQCLQKVKTDEKPRICAVVKPCEAKVSSAECKKRGKELMKALCQCKKEKEAEIAKKLKSIGQEQKKVGVQELIKTVADDMDMQDMMKQVDQCYTENHVDQPAWMKLAMQMFSSGGASSALGKAFSVNGSTVVIMGDMMALDAADETECKECP